MIKKILIITFVLIFSCVLISFSLNTSSATSDASHVYVSSAGNDNYNGLSATFSSSSGSGPKKTIKNAVGMVKSNGTIHLATGTYQEYNIVISKSLTIQGKNRDYTIVRGNQAGRLFKVTSGAMVTLTNLTLTKGYNKAYDGCGGGAILNMGKLKISNCKINSNQATYAGGAVFNWGTLHVENSIFQNNLVIKGHGGAIVNEGTMTLYNSNLKYNQAYNGGAVYNDGKISITKCTLDKNSATKWGGGALCNYGKATVSYTSLNYNNAVYGGAVYNYCETSIKYSEIIGNTSQAGSIVKSGSGSVKANNNWWGVDAKPNSFISGNVAVETWLHKALGDVPLLITSDPVNSAVNVAPDKVIKLYLNKEVKLGSIPIELRNSSGTVIPTVITINGAEVTVGHSDLVMDKKYTLYLPTNCLTDKTGKVLQDTYLTFTTGKAPQLIASKIDPVTRKITITFNKNIQLNSKYLQLINGNGTPMTYKASVKGKILTLIPSTYYPYIYYINPSATPTYDLTSMKKAGITDVFLLVRLSSSDPYYYKTYLPKVIPKFKSAGITLHAWIFPNFSAQDVANITALGVNTHMDLEFGFQCTEYVVQYVAGLRKASQGKLFTIAMNPNAPGVDAGLVYGDNYSLLYDYADAIVPMLYKGNYQLTYSTMKSAAAYMQKQVPNKLWITLQSYKSDGDYTRLSVQSILTEINYVRSNANGIVSFRFGLSNFPGTIKSISPWKNSYTVKLPSGSLKDLVGNTQSYSFQLNI